jgi:hypothetical protein
MLDPFLQIQSSLVSQLLATYGAMVRTSNETLASLVALQGEVVAAQARCSTELWRRYLRLAQEAQLATLSSLQSREPEAMRDAQAMTIDAAQHAIEEAAAAPPQAWNGVERRNSNIAVPIPIERRRRAT